MSHAWAYVFGVRGDNTAPLEGLMGGSHEKHMGKRYYKDDNDPIVE